MFHTLWQYNCGSVLKKKILNKIYLSQNNINIVSETNVTYHSICVVIELKISCLSYLFYFKL